MTNQRLTEDETYKRVIARVGDLMESDPALGSRDGIELDHLAAAVWLYERVKWPMGRTPDPKVTPPFTVDRYGSLGGAICAERDWLKQRYQRAVWVLQDIAALAGSTKRKQAGCEMAAHALAQLGEPRHVDEDERGA